MSPMTPPARRPKRIATQWSENAETWSRFIRVHRDPIRTFLIDPAILALAGDVCGRRVLDAGCGEGYLARLLARRGARVLGIDLAADMIRLAREAGSPAGAPIEYRVGSVTSLRGVPDRRFDLAIISMTLMALSAHRRALARVARTVADGGRLLVVVPHPCFFAPDDDYFTPGEMGWRFYRGQPTETAFFHRPLSEYVHAVRAAGLTLVDLHEPRVARRALARHPELEVHRRIPSVVVLECGVGR
jgi:SAM-dependent methyltransferase